MSFSAGALKLLQLNQHGFDFNIQFEQLFFSIIPSILFIMGSIWRTLSQARKPTIVNAPVFKIIKLGTIAVYIGLEFSLVLLIAVQSIHVTHMFIAASALKLVSAISMIALSVMDHSKSPRPSVLLNSYLFLTLLPDAAQARTLFLSSNHKSEITYSSVFSAAIAMKVGILLLEAQQKPILVGWDEKEHSPEETSGIFSLGVFLWLNKLFLIGYEKIMILEDLYPLDSSFDAKLLHDNFAKNMDYSKMKNHKFGLAKVLFRTLIVPFLLPVPLRIVLLAFTFCQPLFIEKLLDYLSRPELDANFGYGFIGASLLIYAGIAISRAFYWYLHHRMRTMARSILVTETFIRATKARIGTSDASAALTLMSTDIERIKMGFRTLHEVWAGLIQAALAGWMLYNRLGVYFLAPLGLVIVSLFALGVLVHFTGDSQRAWMAGVQKRVGLTATVIAGMKNVKISGLSTAVSNFVQKLRVEELAAGARFRKIYIVAALLGFIPLLMGPPLTFAFTQQHWDASKVFTTLSFLTLMTLPLSQIFQATPELISGFACLGRIQAFLECETRDNYRQIVTSLERDPEKIGIDPEIDQAHSVIIQNGNFGWEAGQFALQNVNIQLVKSWLTIVVGPVGSGKSTFCMALLGEIPFNTGSVVLSTNFPHVGFCDQTAFLSNGSIRDNIIGFSPFNDERYAEVIDATALNFDFATLSQGDQTNVGPDGISLSGGQRQRVSLARSLYLQADLLVLDDIFSGLDADTEEQVFRKVFGTGGLLRSRSTTVVLCTHSIRHLPAADYILALGDGTIAEQGNFTQLVASQGYVHHLGLKDSGGSDASPGEITPVKPGQKLIAPSIPTTVTTTASLTATRDTSRQIGDRTVYKHYVQSMGWTLAAGSLFFAALWGFFTNFPSIWLTFWIEDVAAEHPLHSHTYYAGLYALLQICGLISLLLLGMILLVMSVRKAGARLHKDALRTLIRAPLSFLTKTDTGVVVNLFSQDLNLIDTELPDATLNVLFCVFQAIGQAAVMLTSSAYLAISYPLLGGLLYIVQRFYLRTSRQLRLLDLEAKSPLYTHFIDTLRGIATLRAFGFMPNDVQKNAHLINSSQRPSYLLLMIQEWLNLVLDLVVMVMAVVLTTLAVRLHSKSGVAGASLYTLLSFGENLSGIVTYYTKLETSIGAVSRLKTFNESVKPEDKDEEEVTPLESWPQNGAVELKGVSANYGADDESNDATKLALCDIHLTIKPGKKVAICGRTGSGKSSLIALLLKLLDPTSNTAGNTLIDGIPLYHISRSALRQRVIAVPQEAVFLPDGATFQANLDPSDISTPEICQDVLVTVGLWDFVQERGGLDAGMYPGTLSAGQRQLLSLGRALLRSRTRARNHDIGAHNLGLDTDTRSTGGLLLLDEVSSSVDHITELVMQEIIRDEFKGYTVIAVSHRLDMIMDFDEVVVMEAGKIVEIGNPETLAADARTRFGRLVTAASK